MYFLGWGVLKYFFGGNVHFLVGGIKTKEMGWVRLIYLLWTGKNFFWGGAGRKKKKIFLWGKENLRGSQDNKYIKGGVQQKYIWGEGKTTKKMGGRGRGKKSRKGIKFLVFFLVGGAVTKI